MDLLSRRVAPLPETPTLMQGSEVKERKKSTANLPNQETCHRNRSESNPHARIATRMPLPLHYRDITIRAPKCRI